MRYPKLLNTETALATVTDAGKCIESAGAGTRYSYSRTFTQVFNARLEEGSAPFELASECRDFSVGQSVEVVHSGTDSKNQKMWSLRHTRLSFEAFFGFGLIILGALAIYFGAKRALFGFTRIETSDSNK